MLHLVRWDSASFWYRVLEWRRDGKSEVEGHDEMEGKAIADAKVQMIPKT